jgi:maleate isomerase
MMIRLGLIVPSTNTTMETEFNKWLPKGFSIHTTRINLPEVTELEKKIEVFKSMNQEIKKASILVSSVEPSLIIYGCTSGSIFEETEDEIKKIIEETTSIRAITVMEAVLSAFELLNLSKICMVTPYPKEIDMMEKAYIEKKLPMVNILKTKGLGILGNLQKGRLSPEVAYQTALDVDCQNCNGLFISCTNFRTFEIIQRLEDKIQKPVVTSNQATLWYALKNCNTGKTVEGLGMLMSKS